MPRATNNPASRRRRKRVLKQTSGFRGARSRLYRTAQESLNRSLVYAYRDRRNKRRTLRQLWIVRISAACKELDYSYSYFIAALKNANVILDRKILSELAINDRDGFSRLVDLAKKQVA